jgi:hypothetical protein
MAESCAHLVKERFGNGAHAPTFFASGIVAGELELIGRH